MSGERRRAALPRARMLARAGLLQYLGRRRRRPVGGLVLPRPVGEGDRVFVNGYPVPRYEPSVQARELLNMALLDVECVLGRDGSCIRRSERHLAAEQRACRP